MRSSRAETLERAIIEVPIAASNPFCGRSMSFRLWKELPNQPVGILVAAALPRGIWAVKVEIRLSRRAICLCQENSFPLPCVRACTRFAIGLQQAYHRSVHVFRCLARHRTDRGQAGFPFHQRHPSPAMVCPDEGIEFSIAQTRALLHYRRVLTDGDAIRNLLAPSGHPVMLVALLAQARILTQNSALRSVPATNW